MSRRQLHRAPFLDVIGGVEPTRTPVWFMRQAGRSLPEYRDLRAGTAMLDACFDPEMLAEITLQPVRRHDVDAAILFSDIVVPLKAAGVGVEIVPGRGPVMDAPVRSHSDISALPILDDTASSLKAITDGIAGVLEELRDDQVLIGFAGAPFTLASYLVEGGPSKNHRLTKALMHSEPQLWHELMERLTPTVVSFLETQIAAGVDAIQLFDSWAGFLSVEDYRRFVLPHSTAVLEAVAHHGLPRIHFGVATGELLGDMATAGVEVMGVDWRVPLDIAARRISSVAGPKVLQGNLDPALLDINREVVSAEVARIRAEARTAVHSGDALGHIFNLGHGVLPDTSPEAVTQAADIIHQQQV